MVSLQHSINLVSSQILCSDYQRSVLVLSWLLLGTCYFWCFDDVILFMNRIPVSSLLWIPNIKHLCLSPNVHGNSSVGLC